MSFRLTEAADRDIERILEDSLELFGPRQLGSYAGLIQEALERVGRDPLGLGTSQREDLGPGIRSFHLHHVARRRGSASHVVYYLPPDDGASPALIIRLLHDRMEPSHRVASAIPDRVPELPPDEGDGSRDG